MWFIRSCKQDKHIKYNKNVWAVKWDRLNNITVKDNNTNAKTILDTICYYALESKSLILIRYVR